MPKPTTPSPASPSPPSRGRPDASRATDPNDPNDQAAQAERPALSRRRLLGATGAAGAAGLAAGGAGGALLHSATAADGAAEGQETPLASVGTTAVPFHGTHQPGITTPLQAHGHLVAYDLAPGADRRQAAALLRRWSRAAAELMAGRRGDGDTGAAHDAGPSSLTVTIGLGHSFFDATDLTAERPDALEPLPPFSADALDPDRSHGDLWLQVGADDALVAFDALRTLRRAAADAAAPRWTMSGFNGTPGASTSPARPRNLMGQVDGVNNPQPSDADFDERVFVPGDGDPAWMAHGSYAVVRRIRMLLDDWDELAVADQERVLGRRRDTGAPLTGGGLTAPVDLDARRDDGSPVIAANAHVRVSAPATNGDATMLRRSFSYHDGLRADGAPDAGLLFVCWQADPRRAFVPVQRKLDRGDALSAFIRHEASALFAVPGGAAEGEYVGQRLLEGA